MKPNPSHHSDAEEAAIQAGIDADPDTMELDDSFFARARPATETLAPEVIASLRRRGKQQEPTKAMVSIRLDQDLLERLRAEGRGWQGRVNGLLRKAMGLS